jgi:hypothetical protein
VATWSLPNLAAVFNKFAHAEIQICFDLMQPQKLNLCLLLANQFEFMRRVYTDIVNCPDRVKYAFQVTPSVFNVSASFADVARFSHSESF